MAWDLGTTAGKLAVLTLVVAIGFLMEAIRNVNYERKVLKLTTVFSWDATKQLMGMVAGWQRQVRLSLLFFAATALLLFFPSVVGEGHDASAWIEPLGWVFIVAAMGSTLYLTSRFAWHIVATFLFRAGELHDEVTTKKRTQDSPLRNL